MCIDFVGAVKIYPGEQWVLGRNRAEADYGRRGKLWGSFGGAFEPATRQASIVMSPARDGASHIQLLEQMITEFPSES